MLTRAARQQRNSSSSGLRRGVARAMDDGAADGPLSAEHRNGTLVTYEARDPQAGAPDHPTK